MLNPVAPGWRGYNALYSKLGIARAMLQAGPENKQGYYLPGLGLPEGKGEVPGWKLRGIKDSRPSTYIITILI